MTAAGPILAAERTAAALLDLRPAEFRKLVEAGHLPRPREIAPGVTRWDVAALRQLAAGELADGLGDVAW
jgi:predicted DNA-binding transcriptional regulator AlpA